MQAHERGTELVFVTSLFLCAYHCVWHMAGPCLGLGCPEEDSKNFGTSYLFGE